jgi:very-short-patch-repair endonuclease
VLKESQLATEESDPPPDQGEVRWGSIVQQTDTDTAKRVHRVARMLRRNATAAEKKLWYRIRASQLGGFQFRRQFPIGEFIVDFCCRERRLVIERDGSQHADPIGVANDQERTRLISGRGYRVIRFWNEDIITNLDGVLEQVFAELGQPPPNLPLVRGEELAHSMSGILTLVHVTNC